MRTFLILFLILFPFAAAYPIYPLRRRGRHYRDVYVRVIPGIELAASLGLLLVPGKIEVLPRVINLGLQFQAGSLSTLMAVLSAFLWMMTALVSREYFTGTGKINRFYFFWLLTLGALMGVFLSADLFTLFAFFEMMSFTSYVWVAQSEEPAALRAAQTYLAISVFGGMALLVGLLLLYQMLGTLAFDQLPGLVSALEAQQHARLLTAGLFCLTGFGAKAGLVPLHIWLPKAHPVAPAPASALLSGILTKSGVFGMLIVSRYLFFSGQEWNTVVLWLGTATMVLGAVLALFSVDLKRALACSSMSQIGFISIGVAMQGFLGEENALAAWGTVLHMLNHALIKLVLFVAAGVVYMGTHSLNLNDIRGWGRNKPLLKAVFFTGAASIAGVPLFSGYISKTLLHESIVEMIHELEAHGADATGFVAVEWLFLISGGLTVAYMTKLYVALFIDPKADKQRFTAREYMAPATRNAVCLGAIILAVLGLTPRWTMQPLAEWAGEFLRAGHANEVFEYFSWVNLQGALISLGIGAVVYAVVVRILLMRWEGEREVYASVWPEKLDLENLVYRPALRALSFVGAMCARTIASVGDLIVLAGEKLLFLRAPGVFVPKRNENFGVYIRRPKRFLIGESFAFDLTLAGIGLIGALVYILLQ